MTPQATTNPIPAHENIGRVFEAERPLLLSLLYRLTGSRADAEDLTQQTFERALERPPADRTRPWRPWLVRVATNLGRDHLRKRRRQSYVGPWLPTPLRTRAGMTIETTSGPPTEGPSEEPSELQSRVSADDAELERLREPTCTEGRYELMESVSYALLVALEALTPTQRAVWVLREVLEYDTAESAEALGLRPANVRQHLRRARKALASQDIESRSQPRFDDHSARLLIARFLAAIRDGDHARVAALLSEDVQLITDSAGDFHAARVPIVGADKVARFYLNIAHLAERRRTELCALNGGLGLITQAEGVGRDIPTRIASVFVVEPSGKVARIYSIVATRKLDQIRIESR